MLEEIKELLKRAWNFLKKVFVRIVSYVNNVIGFFKSKYQTIIKKRPNAKMISMKIENDLATGNYNTVSMNEDVIVNTFYDQDTGEVVEEATEVISYESLDETTKQKFGDKKMLVIGS